MPLFNNVILITGASRGIGQACRAVCEAKGAKIIPHASGPSSNTDDTFLYEDLSKPEAGARLFSAALNVHGHIDGVINNTGVYLPSPLTGQGWNDGWTKTMAVNVQAPADICRAAVAHFQSRGDDVGSAKRIINIASRAGHRGDGVDHAAYAASKAAVLAMTKTWARGLSGEGIEFYAIAPGWVETRMAPQDIENRKRAVADIPLGRVAAPKEVAHMAAFLLTGACQSAVGATFDINGASYVR